MGPTVYMKCFLLTRQIQTSLRGFTVSGRGCASRKPLSGARGGERKTARDDVKLFSRVRAGVPLLNRDFNSFDQKFSSALLYTTPEHTVCVFFRSLRTRWERFEEISHGQ